MEGYEIAKQKTQDEVYKSGKPKGKSVKKIQKRKVKSIETCNVRILVEGGEISNQPERYKVANVGISQDKIEQEYYTSTRGHNYLGEREIKLIN